jgi:hypothetical protein
LVFVFDQSFSRGRNGLEAMTAKLTSLRALRIRGVYYDSHACFLVCGKSSARVMRFRKALIQPVFRPKDSSESHHRSPDRPLRPASGGALDGH